MGGFGLPKIKMPKIELPSLPEIKIPEFLTDIPSMPDIDVSFPSLPKIDLPTKEEILTPIAEGVLTTLDPVYGEGGALEPVTVWVDPDRELMDEYGDEIRTGADIGKWMVVGLIALAAVMVFK